jgi:SAM-dependent methyltransferase
MIDFKMILIEKVKRMGPWHYCWELPEGVLTGDSAPNLLLEKMRIMLDNDAFSKPEYREVLDLGANSGFVSKWFADNKGSTVVAVEHAKHYFAQLQFIVEIYGLKHKICPVYEDVTNYKSWIYHDAFDLVLCLGLLHHIKEDEHANLLKACYGTTKLGGQIVVQTDHNLDVGNVLQSVGFRNVRSIYQHISERSAWEATRPTD